MAAVKATLETIMNEPFLNEVKRKSKTFIQSLKEKLEPLPLVKEVKGEGFMIGIQLEDEAKDSIERLRDNGLLTLPAGPKVIRLLPPLTVTEAELQEALTIVERVLHSQVTETAQ